MLLMRKDRSQDDVVGEDQNPTVPATIGTQAPLTNISKVVIACDAGMGSSVMVASTMKNRLSRYGVEVAHTAVDQIPSDTPLILTQEGLVDRARRRAPSARIVPFTN